MSHIVAIVGPTGGVGKTTTAIHLSVVLASAGRSVLLVDCAPQGNASSGLGVAKDLAAQGTADLLFGFCDVARAAMPTVLPGLDLIPATRALVGAELEIAGYANRELRLRAALLAALQSGGESYDHVILDCPPGLGLLTINALAAANGVLLPLNGEFFAMEGLCDALRCISAVRQGLNRKLERLGVLLTMVDRRSRLGHEIAVEARAVFGGDVYEAEIPRDARVSEAASFGMPLCLHAPESRAFEAYRTFTHEFLARVEPPAWASLAVEAS